MAEIHLEKKKSGMGWLWAILAILAVILIAWWLWPTSEVEPVVAVTPLSTIAEPITNEPMTTAAGTPAAAAAAPTIATVMANPREWVGREFSGVVNVAEVPTDRGFWVEQNGQRMFALIIDEPAEKPVDINAGQRIQISTGTLRDAAYLPSIAGAPLTAATENVVREQPIYLVVDERNLTILDRSAA